MKTLDALLPANAGERRTLADIIFSKLDSLEAGKTTVVHKTHHGEISLVMPPVFSLALYQFDQYGGIRPG